MIEFTIVHPRATQYHLGYVPMFFNNMDPRSAADQLHKNYANGGGVNPRPKFSINAKGQLVWNHDELFERIAEATLHPGHDLEEKLIFFTSSYLAIIQKNGDMVVTRVD